MSTLDVLCRGDLSGRDEPRSPVQWNNISAVPVDMSITWSVNDNQPKRKRSISDDPKSSIQTYTGKRSYCKPIPRLRPYPTPQNSDEHIVPKAELRSPLGASDLNILSSKRTRSNFDLPTPEHYFETPYVLTPDLSDASFSPGPDSPQKHRPSFPSLISHGSTSSVSAVPSRPGMTRRPPILPQACHLCHKRPTQMSQLQNFVDCARCGKRSCYICLRKCVGCERGIEPEEEGDEEKGRVCRGCCVEQGIDGECWCLECAVEADRKDSGLALTFGDEMDESL